MATIVINDLEENRELDKEAMMLITGGYGWTGGYDWQTGWYAPIMGSMPFSPSALAYGQAVGDFWNSQLRHAQHFGSSSFDFLNTLNNIVSWARSPI